jgi:hypothetical protein
MCTIILQIDVNYNRPEHPPAGTIKEKAQERDLYLRACSVEVEGSEIWFRLLSPLTDYQ